MSHVAHVTIISRTAQQLCAFKYVFLLCFPTWKGFIQRWQSCWTDQTNSRKHWNTNIGMNSASIQLNRRNKVEDLFYNTPIRKRALKAPADEYKRVVALVIKYAIHNSGVRFNLKKVWPSQLSDTEQFGNSPLDVCTQASSSVLDNISLLFGRGIADELLQVDVRNEQFQFELQAWVTNANYSMKKGSFMFFINSKYTTSYSRFSIFR